MVFGGFAPFIVTWLTHASGSPVAPAWYVLFAASFGLLASVFMHDGAPCVLARRRFQGEPLSASSGRGLPPALASHRRRRQAG